MIPSHLELRLKQLEDNIKQDQDLLKKYEDALRYEDEPRRKTKYSREIEQLRQSANRYQQEYNEILIQISGEPSRQIENVAIQLQQMNTRLDRLSAGQKEIYENINHLRQGLISRYKASEQNIITAMTERLNQSQMITISAVVDAIEANQLSEAEMQNILPIIQQSLSALQASGIDLPANQEAIADILNSSQIDFKNRVKIAVPIIPFILSYEAQLEVGTGIDLKTAWQNLVVRLQGK